MATVSSQDYLNAMTGAQSYTDILNAIRNSASANFKSSVPIATDRNISEVGVGINSLLSHQNEFVTALIDRISLVVIKHKTLNNPLAKFKRGMMPYGYTIEEVYTDITKGKRYDPQDSESTVWKREIPDVKVFFHQRNRQDFYEQTIGEDQLKAAFTSATTFQNFLSSIIEAIYNSAELDEYLYMRGLIDSYYKNGLFFPVKVEVPDTTDKTRAFVKKIRSTARRLSLPMGSRKYNAAGVHTKSDMNGLHLFITAEVEAELDVDVLAVAFNMNRTDFMGHVTVIDEFENPAIQAVLVDENWFMVYDTNQKMNSIYNPKGLYFNYFYHTWQLLSCSTMENAVVFTTEDAPVPPAPVATITPKTATVKKGMTQQFVGAVLNGSETSPKYTVTGGIAGTTITSSGLLTVAASETATSLTVKYEGTVNGTVYSDTATVTVTA